jgi:hypothetical protein
MTFSDPVIPSRLHESLASVLELASALAARGTWSRSEDAAVQKAVCDILEGGEEAFKERARRMRVRLDR